MQDNARVTEQRDTLSQVMADMANGQRAAVDTLYQMTADKLYATIVRIVRDSNRAEDCLQETFVKAWKNATRFDSSRASAITWLCTIARNTALDDVRRVGRSEETYRGTLPDIADDTLPSDDWLCSMEDSESLHRCLETLQPDHRRSIKLAFFDGFSHSELAEKTKVPLGTMKSWIRRGLAELRGCLDGRS